MSEENSGDIPQESSAAPEQNSTEVSSGQENSSPEDIIAAAEAGEISKADAQKMIRKFSLKVRGKDIEREVDLSDEKYIRDQLQLAEVARQEMQSSAELKKAYAKELERWKSNPWEILQELGLDPDELSEKRIQSRIEEMKKSPEQLAAEKYQKELSEAREKLKQLEEEKHQAERSKLEQQALVSLESEIDTALAGHKTLPNSKEVRRNIADTMLWAMGQGFNDVTAADVVPLVEKDMMERLNSLYDDMPDEALDRYISKKTQDRMRKKRLSAAPAAVPSVNAVKPTAQASKASQAPAPVAQKISAKDFFRKK